MTVAQWSWGDHGLRKSITTALAPKVRSLEETVRDLEARQPTGAGRPVIFVLEETPAKADATVGRQAQQRMHFASAEEAVAGVKACLSSGSSSGPSHEVSLSPATFLRHAQLLVPEELALRARWRWDDVGLTDAIPFYRKLADLNPGRWSAETNLKATKNDLEEYIYSVDAPRPVAFEITATGRNSTVLTFAAASPSVAEALASLGELLALQGALRRRDEFSTQGEYEKYAVTVMQDTGGCVGACVRFSTDAFAFVASGAEGVIESFSSSSSFKVDWGSHAASVGMHQCTLIATADGRLSLEGASAEGVFSSMMRAVSMKLRSSCSDPRAFERVCMRLMERNHGPSSGKLAAKNGLCEAVVEALKKDREGSCPDRSVQYSGCLLLWWICSHDAADSDLKLCRARAAEAGALVAAVQARQALPEEAELVGLVRRLVGIIIEGNENRRTMALAAGVDEDWLK